MGYELYLVARPKFETPIIQTGFKTWNQKSWVRIPMYNVIDEFIRKNLSGSGRILELGGSEGTLKAICESAGYNVEVAPDFPKVDIQVLPYSSDMFDGILLDQVLEHTKRPWEAVKEVYRVLREDGFVVATAPLMWQYHASRGWGDYWRFTPEGLAELFQGFDVLMCAGWGNANAIRTMYDGQDVTSSRTTPLNLAAERGILKENDGLNLLTTWIIARKKLYEEQEVAEPRSVK
jgi:SAM-dependent methyltransferase